MNITIVFIVMSTHEPPNTDLGKWSRHETLADAKKVAGEVSGDVWEQINTDGNVEMFKLND